MGNATSTGFGGYSVLMRDGHPCTEATKPDCIVDPSSGGTRTFPFRALTHPNELVKSFVDNSVRTAWDIFQRGKGLGTDFCVYRKRDESGQLAKELTALSYAEAEDAALRVGNALKHHGICRWYEFPTETIEAARRMRLLGVYSKNRYEWFLLEQACNAFGITLVPLYDTLGEDAMHYILGQTGLDSVALSAEVVEKMLSFIDEKQKFNFILFDPPSDQLKDKLKQYSNITIYHFSDMRQFEPAKQCEPPSPSTIWTLCYTSGTTGCPKGVLLPHSAVVACICGVLRGILSDPAFEITSDDMHISYLPLAHVFERAITNVVISKGACIGVYSGDLKKLLEDIQLIQPTIFISVPRMFNRINDSVNAKVKESPPMHQWLFKKGMNAKLAQLRQSATTTHSFWDRVIFNKIARMLGGRLRFMITGGAPLEANIQERMQILFCCALVEGFGLTESIGTSFIQNPRDVVPGHVGGALPSLEFCLESVVDMEYLVTDPLPRGELLIRGPTLAEGYLMQPEETAKAFADGWFHTGDIVTLLPHGGVKVIDRKKNIFKLAQGEYIAPEKVEAVYQQCGLVSQVFCYGMSTKYVLVGIIVPDEDAARRWCDKEKVKLGGLEELCKLEAFHKAVCKEMAEMERTGNLKGFEKIKKVHLHPELFSEANDLLTPTFKLKRHQAKRRFKNELDKLYEELDREELAKGPQIMK